MDSAAGALAFRAGSDELGVFALASVDPHVFPNTVLFKTAYWFTDHYYLRLAREPSGNIAVEFRPKQGDDIEALKAACGEFGNKLLDYVVREKVLAQTSVVRDTLVKKAFFEAKAPLPACGVADESALRAEPG
jgi:His-Xaa-Ser system protein HxsD